jgi:ketosteroid isomerase-like protein
MKTCSKCGVEKDISEFYKRKQSKDGFNRRCIPCLNEYAREKRKEKQLYSTNKKVVYLHRKATNNIVFYVGMGELKRAYNTESRSKWWKKTYKKHGRIVDIVAQDLNIDDAYELEMFLISEIGRKDKGLGSLVNLDDGGDGATGHIPTQSARRKLSKRMSKKVINTETLEVLKSGTELLNKYGLYGGVLQKEHPKCDWMKLEDYKKGKHLTEKWINRYKIGFQYLKIINTETLDIFYSIKEAAKSINNGSFNKGKYNHLTSKLKGSRENKTNLMYYDDYKAGKHLTKEWKNRKVRKTHPARPSKEIELYDFKKEVWFKTTTKDFKLKYNIKPCTHISILNGRFGRREYFENNRKAFDKTKHRWKNVYDLHTGKTERFNQWHLAKKLNVKNTNNLSSFFLKRRKTLYKRYVLVD